jgi:ferredoxin
MLSIHPTECVSCGACESICPVQAIYPVDFLPEALREYAGVNAQLFTDLGFGSPGGATQVGPLDHDPEPISRRVAD